MKTKTRTKTSKKRHPAASRSKSHRKALRRGHSSRVKRVVPVVTPTLIEEETFIETVRSQPPYDLEADKRDEELSDEEILDREEKQHLY